MHTIKIDLTISFLSKWHCGSGEGGLLADRLIQRDVRHLPYIPGSSLRGVVREHCENISRILKIGDPANPHDPRLDTPGKFAPLSQAPSLVEALFGNNFEEGGLFFRNATLIESPGQQSFVHCRTAMDRFLGTVKEKQLFSTEHGVPLEFATSILGFHRDLVMSNLDLPYGYWLLVLGLLSVGRLGGDKTTGSGQVNLNLTAIFYNDQEIEIAQVWDNMVLLGELIEEYKSVLTSSGRAP